MMKGIGKIKEKMRRIHKMSNVKTQSSWFDKLTMISS